jgi:AP-3 complex subunit sigma
MRAGPTTTLKMIKAVIIVNDAGQARLVRWFDTVPDHQKASLLRRIFLSVARRDDRACNFLDADGGLPGSWAQTKLVYRHYATLYFIFVCEETESELGILDLIQVFVETLDRCFESVCELDLIFHADRVNYVLDEIVQGGLVLETNILAVLKSVDDLQKLERAPVSIAVQSSAGAASAALSPAHSFVATATQAAAIVAEHTPAFVHAMASTTQAVASTVAARWR